MSICKRIYLLAIVFFAFPSLSFAASYSETFQSLSVGSLSGQGGWTNSGNMDVQSSLCKTGQCAGQTSNAGGASYVDVGYSMASSSLTTVTGYIALADVSRGALIGIGTGLSSTLCRAGIDSNKFFITGGSSTYITNYLPTSGLIFKIAIELDTSLATCRLIVDDVYATGTVSVNGGTAAVSGGARVLTIQAFSKTGGGVFSFDDFSVYEGNAYGSSVSSTTGAVAILSPVANTITASTTFTTSFTYVNNQTANTANGYELIFTHLESGEQRRYRGSLSTPSAASATQSTTTVAWRQGTYSLNVDVGSLTAVGYTSVGPTIGERFGVVSSDSYGSLLTAYGGIATTSATAADCAISFLGSFDLKPCVEYLFVPSTASLQSLAALGLESRAPFAYLYGTLAVVNNFFNGAKSSAGEVAVTVGTWHIVFLNQSMIASGYLVSTLKTLLSAGMLIATALTMYAKLYRRFGQQQLA